MALPVGHWPCAMAGKATKELPSSRALVASRRWMDVRRCMAVVSYGCGKVSKARLFAGKGWGVLAHLRQVVAVADAAAQIVVVQPGECLAIQCHAQARSRGHAQ